MILLPDIHNINFSFLLNNFPFVHSLCFCNNFFFFSLKLMFLLNILKDPFNHYYKGKCEIKVRNFFFLWFFSSYSMIYTNVGVDRDPLKKDLALEFCRNQNKDIRILTGIHINHDQIHHIKKLVETHLFLSWR